MFGKNEICAIQVFAVAQITWEFSWMNIVPKHTAVWLTMFCHDSWGVLSDSIAQFCFIKLGSLENADSSSATGILRQRLDQVPEAKTQREV